MGRQGGSYWHFDFRQHCLTVRVAKSFVGSGFLQTSPMHSTPGTGSDAGQNVVAIIGKGNPGKNFSFDVSPDLVTWVLKTIAAARPAGAHSVKSLPVLKEPLNPNKSKARQIKLKPGVGRFTSGCPCRERSGPSPLS